MSVLHVHRAERADRLVDALGALLATPPEDPFAPEVVAVPTRGMERWLTQRLSSALGASDGRRDGVCANVGFPSPRGLVGEAVAAACALEEAADDWAPERAVWPLLDVVEDCLGEPWLGGLAAHLGAGQDAPDPARRARRFATVRHLADLYDRYGLQRPEMVRAWATGEDTDGAGAALAPADAWQAELWRRLRARIAQPGPAERLAHACGRLREDPTVSGLPRRLCLFGLTRLPAGHLDVLRALAAAREVHLLLLHPSPALWERVARTLGAPSATIRRRDDQSGTPAANRLLASWGQGARELQLVLGAPGATADHYHAIDPGEPATLLERLQADVRADRRPPGIPLPGQEDRRAPLAPEDASVRIHACHGRARQVEVVRDAILHLLAEDPALEPRDVVVMCPDVETFAPLIQATFGAGEVSEEEDEPDPAPAGARPPDLRVRLADRSLRQTNPVLGVVGRLLELARERLTASQVLDLADREPVRRRFELDDDDLARMEDWVAASGIRWGLDASHRAPYKLERLADNTWRSGLDRVLVGVTMTEDDQRLFGGILPLDDVDSGAIDLAGRFAELVDRLGAALAAFATSKPIDAWAAEIAAAADALTATTARDAWQRSELQRLLDDVVTEATAGGVVHAAPLAPGEIRALLAERLRGRPTRANFRTGHLTICTLVPMRSVPHRVVCLLGIDDAAFPRKAPRDGDDLLLHDPRVGDRDPRAEDRQMLLDALLAAKDRLIVTYTGNDERTNAVRPPAVPVGELLDVVDRTVRAAAGQTRTQIVIRHPLQPFDPRNFTAGALGPRRPWSFDRVTLEGARALAGERTAPGHFLAQALGDLDERVVELDQLVRFVEHPVRAFLRRRLGIGVADFSEEIQDALPVELDNLGLWGVGQRLLDARLAGATPEAALAAELARGALPPGRLAEPVLARVGPVVEEIAGRLRALLGDDVEPASTDVKIVLGDGRSLSGTVAGVSGDVLRAVTYSRVSPKHRLAAWVRVLALTAADPERPFSAATVGRVRPGVRSDASVTVAHVPALGPDPETRQRRALEHLAVLVDLHDRGMREPPPIACRTSAAYAAAAAAGRNPAADARGQWQSGFQRPNEDVEPEHQLVLGGVRTFAALSAPPPHADEHGDGWEADDPSRFGRHARRLWAGLLACEVIQDR